MKIDWKSIGIPIVVAIIAFSGTTLGIIISFLLKPDVKIELTPEKESINEATMSVKNEGWAPAKNLKLTVEYPHKVVNLNIFSTENYSETNRSQVLEINVPRFAQGEGSLVKIGSTMDPHSNITAADQYNAYLTHDQGSVSFVSAVSTGEPKDVFEQFRVFYNDVAGPLISSATFVASVAGIVAYYIQGRRKMKGKEKE